MVSDLKEEENPRGEILHDRRQRRREPEETNGGAFLGAQMALSSEGNGTMVIRRAEDSG